MPDLEIKVTIEATELVSALNALANVLQAQTEPAKATSAEVTPMGTDEQETVEESVQTEPEPEAEPPKKRRGRKKAEPEPEAEPESEEPDLDNEEEITYEDVRAKLAEMSRAGKKAQVRLILEKCGGPPLSKVPPEQYRNLLKMADALEKKPE